MKAWCSVWMRHLLHLDLGNSKDWRWLMLALVGLQKLWRLSFFPLMDQWSRTSGQVPVESLLKPGKPTNHSGFCWHACWCLFLGSSFWLLLKKASKATLSSFFPHKFHLFYCLYQSIWYSRMGFLGITIITSAAGFLSTFSPNYVSLVILSCLVGVGLGGGPVLSSWFLEFVPVSHRGSWMVVFSTFWRLGTIFEAALAWVSLFCFLTFSINIIQIAILRWFVSLKF